MKDKTDQIIQAALKVFVNKGFLQATTVEIAREANVNEVTLYRKFSTKHNLFETVIKRALENQFGSKVNKLAKENTDDFFSGILDDRLMTLSRNRQMVKMLLSESLLGNLSEELNFPALIFNGLKKGIQLHFDCMGIESDASLFAQLIAGILLSSVLFSHETLYYQLPEREKQTLLNQYLLSLRANL